MWFWCSLIAILFWSGSDLFSKIGSEPEDKNSHWKMVAAVGIVMGLHAGFELWRGVPFGIRDLLTYLPVSLLYILAMVLGYVGLRYVVLSVSTPICNSSGAVAALLCFFFLNQKMSRLQLFAIALISLGILSLSAAEKAREEKERIRTSGSGNEKDSSRFIAIMFPIFYCMADGLGTFADALVLNRYLAEKSANIAYEFTFLILAAGSLFYLVVIKKEKLKFSKEKPKLLAGVCETAGQFAYIFAIGENAIVAAPLISSYCMFSVLWARLFLRERLVPKQYVSILVAVAGIVLLGMEGA